jgi:hypothetical protein
MGEPTGSSISSVRVLTSSREQIENGAVLDTTIEAQLMQVKAKSSEDMCNYPTILDNKVAWLMSSIGGAGDGGGGGGGDPGLGLPLGYCDPADPSCGGGSGLGCDPSDPSCGGGIGPGCDPTDPSCGGVGSGLSIPGACDPATDPACPPVSDPSDPSFVNLLGGASTDQVSCLSGCN